MIRVIALFILTAWVGYADRLCVAVASSVRGPMGEIAEAFHADHPDCEVQIVVGSSGKLAAQIVNGAPYDMFFSADMLYPEKLFEEGVAQKPRPYARGRLVIWGPRFGMLELDDLTNETVRHISVANLRLAPYGRAALETLQSSQLFEPARHKLVYAENVSQALHFVESGAADAGFVALSLLRKGYESQDAPFALVSEELHKPILHGYVALKDSNKHKWVKEFSSFMRSKGAEQIFIKYGFLLSSQSEVYQP